MEIINIKNLSFQYMLGNRSVLNDINLSINEGDFVLICGESGCGKTTLLKHFKKEIAPYGTFSGDIYYKNKKIKEMDLRQSATSIGYVMQNPDNQIVTDKVWHELAFGLENIGVPPSEIRRRVAEMANFFGIHHLFREDSDKLSGGQKQILNLAATMLLQPDVLVLDEPTSQLDPIAAVDFIETLKKINEEFSTTIILVEHRLEEVFKVANKIVVMEDGKICGNDNPYQIANSVKFDNPKHNFFVSLPTSMRVALALGSADFLPISVKEGKSYLRKIIKDVKIDSLDYEEISNDNEEIISMKNVYFRYYKEGVDILRGLSLSVKKNDVFCILGGNGSGKTTAINNIAGILKPYRGKILVNNQDINKKGQKLPSNYMEYLPQNPTLLFSKDSVSEELNSTAESLSKNNSSIFEELEALIEEFDIRELLNQHPYDISGGEQQKVAIIKLLLSKPSIILLDEPTKGLDASFKISLANILNKLVEKGLTIIIVSHDIEFCAEYGTTCAMFFDGNIISQDNPRTFFTNNNFYTTAAAKLSRNIFKNTILCQDVIELCQKNLK